MGHAPVTSDVGVIQRHTHTWEKARVHILTKPLGNTKEICSLMLQRILPGRAARAEVPPRFRNAPSVTGADLIAFIMKARIRSMNHKRATLL